MGVLVRQQALRRGDIGLGEDFDAFGMPLGGHPGVFVASVGLHEGYVGAK